MGGGLTGLLGGARLMDAAPPQDGEMPLHVAAKSGNTIVIGMLLKAGADVKAQDNVSGAGGHNCFVWLGYVDLSFDWGILLVPVCTIW